MIRPLTRPAPMPEDGLNPLERQLLDTLARTGPIPAARLPVRWPLIRMHLPVLLDRLAAAGRIRLSPPDGAPAPETLVVPAQSAGSSRARTPLELSVRT